MINKNMKIRKDIFNDTIFTNSLKYGNKVTHILLDEM